ncbi:DUF5694 domain-containing protein [Hymenobacter terrestris]|uniref:TraB/GumN family protein n=1 Tax=Hymenobacter terrestris TaxID=2748310 RepID=A0ABX2Q262_9BACT|nr:DUF5694 domain-containing protein [Hymenobacter terrestris]NVO84106.1 hypothetical protein [Hymenobacter terrestris]
MKTRHFLCSILMGLLSTGSIPGIAVAQAPLEVLIVASSHVNTDPAAEYRPIVEKLKAYQPDLVFGEYVSAPDMKQLPADNYAKSAFIPRYHYVRRRNPTARLMSDAALARAEKALAAFPYYHKTRIDVARHHVLSYDPANAAYQLYVLEQEMKSRFGADEQVYYARVFGGADSLRLKGFLRPNNEYGKIFFPLLYELRQARIYGMDSQQYDADWGHAWQAAREQVEAMQARVKADSTLPEAATARRIKAATAAYSRFWDQADDVPGAYRIMNGPAYAGVDEGMNFLGGEALYGFPGFPTEQVKAMKAQWVLRNEAMCANVVQRARQQQARRVVVAVGASHGHIMRELLSRMPGVKVIGYNELP